MEQDARTQKHATCGTLYQCRIRNGWSHQVGYGKGLKSVSLSLVKSLVEPFSPYRPYLASGFAFEMV